MNNYIILNGINSNTITGLIIQSLPPISKPLMRTNIETIDGKDGDIITKLGYSAYDKEISIGLSYNYNVDDVIEFFNSEGTVIFSNEPTKYYKYTILDQIDFNRLIRFKTATVRMHVQPFKYSTTEEDIEENATETDAEGTNFTLENTENGAGFLDLKIKGDTYQEQREGTNLLSINAQTQTINGITFTNNNNGTITVNGTATANAILILNSFTFESGQTYTLSGCASGGSLSTYRLDAWGTGGLSEDIGNGVIINVAGTRNVRIVIFSGTTINNLIFKPMINKGSTALSYEPYGYHPSPTNPSEIKVVTGDNTVTLCGKNLFDKENIESGKYVVASTGELETLSITFATDYISIMPNTTYYWNDIQNRPNAGAFYDKNKTYIAGISNRLFTTPNNAKYVRLTGANTNLALSQLEKGNQATTYEPYQSQSYTLSLGDIELCKIGDYQDYIYPANNTWYIHKEIAKIILNGTESYSFNGSYNYNVFVLTVNDINKTSNIKAVLSNYYNGVKNQGLADFGNNYNYSMCARGYNDAYYHLYISNDDISSVDSFKSWLSTHNTYVYYVLATATDTEITDTTLLSQLNALKGATTYEGQTNIITAGDLQPIIYVKTFAMDNPSYTVTNSGNYFAKPVMTIYGIGTVGVYLDGVQVLSLNLNENQTDHITIDVPNMNAYTDTINTLRNRAVTGDYNNLKFNVGDNELSFSGTIQGFIIQNYSRWL